LSSLKINLKPETNFSGGTLGGISTGENIYFRVAIKPVSTISKEQITCNWEGGEEKLKATGRHDPCVLPRAMPIVESMAAIVVMDLCLIQMSRQNSVNIKDYIKHDFESDNINNSGDEINI
jgi:chorismate synthase